ncbi:hypothetical protein SLS53_000350 [Cytospora paraplurivora]|uniref:Probable beta-glucosidase F n=1 Tax=Cytospora paraplurivora TaxID=2898453 RepID=A0AAN9UL34_9PEZI
MADINSAWSRGLVVGSLFITLSLGASIGGRAAVPDGYVAAPYYPTPYTGWVSSWSDSVQKAKALVDTMTLAEKANITAGTGFFMGSAPRIGFPQLCIQDSALGVRDTDNVTVFPPGITTGATFDKTLMYQRGVAIGKEFRGKGANVYLGPTVGPLGRKPRDGRSWEGFGADPVLQAIAGSQTIKGANIGTSYWMYEMSRAVLNGSVPVDRLDDAATRIVAAWYQLGQDEGYPEPNFSSYTSDATGLLHIGALSGPSGVVNKFVDVRADHATVARQVAQDAITLVKNNDSLLPLSTETPLFLFGTDQKVNPDGANACSDRSCDTGTLGTGWGSGTANYETFNDPLTAIEARAANVTSYYTDSFPSLKATPSSDDVAIVFITSDSGENSYTVELNAGDRSNSGLVSWHDGDKLVKAAAAKYSSVVVVVHTVGPIVVEPWIDLDSVKAVLFAYLPGQEAGESLANVLFGTVSPSGHLPFTIPVAEDDYPDSVSLTGFGLGQIQDTYTEGLYIDYRYLNSVGTKPRYAFGHGLSYANFTYTNATITKVTQLTKLPPTRAAKTILEYNTTIPAASEAYKPSDYDSIYIWRYLYPWLSDSDADAAAATAAAVASGEKDGYPYPEGYSTNQTAGPAAGGGLGGNDALWDTAYTVSVTVTNTGGSGAGNYSGKAVAQAYVQFPADSGYDTPVIQLRDFEKTDTLAPGESQTLELTFTRKDVSVWDVVEQNWVVPVVDGAYKLWIGEASDALYLACDASTLVCEDGLTAPV